MEEVERCPGCGANLALVGRVHRCVAKPPVSNVTEVIPNKPDVIPNTVSNAVSNKAGTAKTATRLQTRMVQVASQKPGTQFRQGRCAKVGLEASRVAHKFHPLISLWISRYGRG